MTPSSRGAAARHRERVRRPLIVLLTFPITVVTLGLFCG
jgi:hypothetical protein